jgi:hypothetical protein
MRETIIPPSAAAFPGWLALLINLPNANPSICRSPLIQNVRYHDDISETIDHIQIVTQNYSGTTGLDIERPYQARRVRLGYV